MEQIEKMGVDHLWDILDPVKTKKSLDCLQGQTLSIDLNIWICEAEYTPQLKNLCPRPYLRNLFFRVRHLQQIGAYPIFVLDGEAPVLKSSTIIKRRQKTPDPGGWRSTSKLQCAASNRLRSAPVKRPMFQKKLMR